MRGWPPQLSAVVWLALCMLTVTPTPRAPASFVTFESGQVRPLALSPDGTRLFAVNTPDNQLEIFSVAGGALSHVGAVPVGLEPVAVAARTNGEVWVVNHLSDSVSIVDVAAAKRTSLCASVLYGSDDRVTAAPAPARATSSG